MIQRLQSILLFLAASACVAFLFLPTWMVVNPDTGDGGSKTISSTPMGVDVETSAMSLDNPFTEEHLSMTSNTFLLIQALVVMLAALVLVANIFLYNNRALQIKVGYIAIVLIMVSIVLIVPIRNWLQEMGGDAGLMAEYYQSIPKYGLGIPVVALLLTLWAVKRIQRDEKLVQSMDRIR